MSCSKHVPQNLRKFDTSRPPPTHTQFEHSHSPQESHRTRVSPRCMSRVSSVHSFREGYFLLHSIQTDYGKTQTPIQLVSRALSPE